MNIYKHYNLRRTSTPISFVRWGFLMLSFYREETEFEWQSMTCPTSSLNHDMYISVSPSWTHKSRTCVLWVSFSHTAGIQTKNKQLCICAVFLLSLHNSIKQQSQRWKKNTDQRNHCREIPLEIFFGSYWDQLGTRGKLGVRGIRLVLKGRTNIAK